MFIDRADAGRRLAAALSHLKESRPVVLALPRGGVPVALEIANALAAPLDLVLVRKIGAPGHEEFGIGAVVDGPDPIVWLDEGVSALLHVDPEYVETEKRRQLAEIERRRALWLGGRPPPPLEGRTAIVVDDGVATGGTMRAALRAVRRRRPARLVMAVPVAAPDALADLKAEVDEAVCLSAPPIFHAVGMFYADFHQLADSEVAALLGQAEGNGGTGPS